MIRRGTGDSSSLSATLKSSAAASLPAVLSAFAVWLALSLGSPCMHGAVAQEGETGTKAQQTKGTPTIAATPERVEVTEASGSTEIGWNTGNGSTGFVFVTANGRPPVLVATGRQGSRVISWIRTGRYVFELYGDAERQTLLAKATVSGVAEIGAAPHTALWQGRAPRAACCSAHRGSILRVVPQRDRARRARNFLPSRPPRLVRFTSRVTCCSAWLHLFAWMAWFSIHSCTARF